jgi:hypothetical protein
MRVPRLRIWLLMLVVALAALGSAARVLVKRSREYTRIAAMHERGARLVQRRILRITRIELEIYGNQRLSEATRRAIAERDESERRQIDNEKRTAAAYRRAALYPWLGPPRIEENRGGTMRLPHVRNWIVMLVVAFAGLGAASWSWARKAKRLSAVAAQREMEELRWTAMASHCDSKLHYLSEALVEYNKVVAEVGAGKSEQRQPDADEIKRRITHHDNEARKYRRLAASAHASAVSYRRTARYPWL